MPPQGTTDPLAPYLPRLVRRWSAEPDGPRHRAVDGSLVSVDVSGFTALAERLQEKGRAGAEELVQRISGVFDELITVAERHGGDVLKFRGDALLLLFTGDQHAARACGAASDMQDAIARVGRADASAGVELRMSGGVHSGSVDLFLTETPHRELLVAGPAATRVFELEDLAQATEIVVSAETAAAVDPGWLAGERQGAFVMHRLGPGASPVPPPEATTAGDLEPYVPAALRDHLAVASGEAEHRQVTVAFVKLSGTDDLLAAEGPDALLEVVDRLADAVGRACARYGLTWLESDIDLDAAKLYLTGGAPSSSGDDEEGMLLALRDVLAAGVGLPLRAGVNRGHVFTGDIGAASRRTYAVMGDAVNLAARLTARAQPGRIVATSDVLERARTLYRTETEPLLVKGKEQAVLAHAVGEAIGVRPRAAVDTTPILGRDGEVAALSEAVELARMRQLQVVELVGEPGIGKSRLVQELRTLALGFQHLDAAAEQYLSSEPYAAVRGLLRQVVGITPDRAREDAGAQLAPFVAGMMPDLAPWLPLLAIPFDADVADTPETAALDPAASRDRLHWVVGTFLERILMMPTLIAVEDVHWLDDASRALLSHLVAQPAPRPWLVCATTRPGGDPLAHAAPHCRRLELAPLEGDSAEALALAVAQQFALSSATVHALAERSGGNPLFVRELVLAAQHGQSLDALPESVESLLTTRIDTLPPADRMLLRYAAVVGPSFELDVLGEILGEELPGAASPERWAGLAEFVVPAGEGTLGFRHDLVRATAYAGLSFRRRRDIHGRVGAVLERRAGDRADEEAALLSLHFLEAGQSATAWRYALLAAAHARDGFANVVAAQLYERALAAADGLPALPQDEVARTWESLGDVRERFGAYEQARAAYARAHDLAADPLARARVGAGIALCIDREGRYEEAERAYAAAEAELDAAGGGPESTRIRSSVAIGLAGAAYRRAAYDEAVARAEQAAELAERVDDRGRLAHALYVAALAHTDLGRDDAVPLLERAIPMLQELGDHRREGAALNNLGIHRYTEGRWDEALRLYGASREAKLRAGDPVGAAVQDNNVAEVLSDQGRLDDAEPLFRDMVRVCAAAGFPIGAALGTSNLARVAARAGRFDEAHALYEEAVAGFEAIDAGRYVNETRARLAECLVLEGRHAEAIAAASALVADARETPFGGLEAMVERTLAYALCQARRPDEALPHLEESLRRARELDALYEVALTLRALADAQPDGEAFRAESDDLLARLGVVRLPKVPLP